MSKITVTTHAEINALVAQQVMGWKKCKSTTELTVADSFYNHGDILINHYGKMVRIFKPSVDISDAWQVVEKMKAAHVVSMIAATHENKCMSMRLSDAASFEATSFSIPLAICLCALASFGVEIDLLLKEK